MGGGGGVEGGFGGCKGGFQGGFGGGKGRNFLFGGLEKSVTNTDHTINISISLAYHSLTIPLSFPEISSDYFLIFLIPCHISLLTFPSYLDRLHRRRRVRLRFPRLPPLLHHVSANYHIHVAIRTSSISASIWATFSLTSAASCARAASSRRPLSASSSATWPS